jgi:hypothetical protein
MADSGTDPPHRSVQYVQALRIQVRSRKNGHASRPPRSAPKQGSGSDSESGSGWEPDCRKPLSLGGRPLRVGFTRLRLLRKRISCAPIVRAVARPHHVPRFQAIWEIRSRQMDQHLGARWTRLPCRRRTPVRHRKHRSSGRHPMDHQIAFSIQRLRHPTSAWSVTNAVNRPRVLSAKLAEQKEQLYRLELTETRRRMPFASSRPSKSRSSESDLKLRLCLASGEASVGVSLRPPHD